ncbi:MAG: hypothetical protein J5J00_17160 [Deltaproteobacteria bacterium]|nr:hypothetical protein [Deltaproteobacteria bacterium]
MTSVRTMRWCVIPGAIFFIALAANLIAGITVIRHTEPPTGDQPYFLMTAISIVEDGDIDEANNYSINRSFDYFYPPMVEGGMTDPLLHLPPEYPGYPSDFKGILAFYPLWPENHIGPKPNRPSEEWYSKHPIGMPLLIAPVWALGTYLSSSVGALTYTGHGGWPAVVFEMNILAALLALELFLLIKVVLAGAGGGIKSINRWAAFLALTFSLTAPIIAYSSLVFPEIPAALLVTAIFRRIIENRFSGSAIRSVFVALLIAALILLHQRFAPLAAGLALIALLRFKETFRSDARPAAYFIVTLAVAGAFFLLFQFWLYGSFFQSVDDHGGFVYPLASQESFRSFGLALFGLFFDQKWGLVLYNPLYAVLPFGVFIMLKQPALRPLLYKVLIPLLPYFLLIAIYKVWWGEWGPPGRYLVAITPLLIVPISAGIYKVASSIAARGIFTILAGGAFIFAFALIFGLTKRGPADIPTLFNHSFGPASALSWIEGRIPVDLHALTVPVVDLHVVLSEPLPTLKIWITLALCLVLNTIMCLISLRTQCSTARSGE